MNKNIWIIITGLVCLIGIGRHILIDENSQRLVDISLESPGSESSRSVENQSTASVQNNAAVEVDSVRREPSIASEENQSQTSGTSAAYESDDLSDSETNGKGRIERVTEMLRKDVARERKNWFKKWDRYLEEVERDDWSAGAVQELSAEISIYPKADDLSDYVIDCGGQVCIVEFEEIDRLQTLGFLAHLANRPTSFPHDVWMEEVTKDGRSGHRLLFFSSDFNYQN